MLSSLNSLSSFASLTSINKPQVLLLQTKTLSEPHEEFDEHSLMLLFILNRFVIQQQNHSVIQGERMFKPINGLINKMN